MRFVGKQSGEVMGVDLRGEVIIAGVGETRVGKVPELSCMALHAQAAHRALEDAGIGIDEVDGVLTHVPLAQRFSMYADAFAEYMGIHPRFCSMVRAGGATPGQAIWMGAMAIGTGLCDVVLVAVADSLRSGLSGSSAVESLAEAGHAEFELPHGIHIPSLFGLIARRHMIEYETTSEQLAAVAVTMRHHASMNPGAQMRAPITVADVLASKVVADPLHILDCSLISDGGGAVVLTSAERARTLKRKPAYILGYGEAHDGEHVSQLPDLTQSGAKRSGEQAFRMAGCGPQDINVAMLYDCFTISVLIELEDLGFCKKGEAGPFVAAGNCRLGARLPVNPHGGLLSYAHAGRTGSIFHTIEAVRQLRGESGNRQVPGADLALVHGMGGAATVHCTLVLGSGRG